jgi:hypothetical protein
VVPENLPHNRGRLVASSLHIELLWLIASANQRRGTISDCPAFTQGSISTIDLGSKKDRTIAGRNCPKN